MGTYVLPKEEVEITGTDMLGWDGHNVVRYEARLEDAFLHHAIAGLSEPEAFYETAGVIYWISIAAWDGVTLDANGNPIDAGTPVRQITTLPDGTAVAAQQGKWLVTSFHPELTGDGRFHAYFLGLAEDSEQ